jgi:hypothetical protein
MVNRLACGKAKCIVFFVLAVMISFVLGLVVAFSLGRLYRAGLGIRESWVTIKDIAGHEALVIDLPDQERTGPFSCDFLDVAFDDQNRCIDISHVVMLLNPFSRDCQVNQPIVVRNGLLPGSYAVRYWDGKQFVVLGSLRVEETKKGEGYNKLVWHAAGRAGTEGIGP